MRKSEQINEIAKALSKCQAQMKPAQKDGMNPHFKSKFSSINSIWDALRDPLTVNFLSVVQDVTTEPGFAIVETEIHHESGQWIQFGPLKIPVMKQDAQGYGSAISYAKRYALCGAFGIVSDEDDDANLASQQPKKTQHLDPRALAEFEGMLTQLPNYRPEYLNYVRKTYGIREFSELTPEQFNASFSNVKKILDDYLKNAGEK